jgi:hypothetical protein
MSFEPAGGTNQMGDLRRWLRPAPIPFCTSFV